MTERAYTVTEILAMREAIWDYLVQLDRWDKHTEERIQNQVRTYMAGNAEPQAVIDHYRVGISELVSQREARQREAREYSAWIAKGRDGDPVPTYAARRVVVEPALPVWQRCWRSLMGASA